ncbi:MAG TPA: SGNH/GDSL hydrolase family protein, partial [Propionibacteriaceae bacterium]
MYRFRHLAAAFASSTVLLTMSVTPAHAAGGSFVALGDSYSSGTGTRSYLNDGTSCQRSVYAYPSLIASSKGLALNFRACSGATIADVSKLQLNALGTGTAYVSVTAGGNDASFASVLTECAKPAWASNCNGAIDRAESIIKNTVPGRLVTLYAGIRSRAPQARVVAAGYPRVFNGEDCNLLTWFSPAEETRLNQTSDLLNTKIATAAASAGFGFSNPTGVFVGHAVCDTPEWLNGLSSPTGESYHPNRLGHSSGYSPLVSTALIGSPVPVSAPTQARAADSSRRLAAQQRSYAAQDRAIRPKPFRAPDLSSPQIVRAAARAGVDLSSRASIDAADRRYAAQQARARHEDDGSPVRGAGQRA